MRRKFTRKEWIRTMVLDPIAHSAVYRNKKNLSIIPTYEFYEGRLEDMVEKEMSRARIEALQWALNDLNMPDTDTKKNLEEFIRDETNKLRRPTPKEDEETQGSL
jgi:hypothetical protein